MVELDFFLLMKFSWWSLGTERPVNRTDVQCTSLCAADHWKLPQLTVRSLFEVFEHDSDHRTGGITACSPLCSLLHEAQLVLMREQWRDGLQ